MDRDFWLDKWASNQIGFHEAETHPMLRAYWDRIEAGPAATVFVPLCGKSRDMLWLNERGHDVVGVELSEIAVADFFAENGLPARRRTQGAFGIFESPGYRLICGDYFALTPDLLGPIGAAYDRAALIALPPALRGEYARLFARLLGAGNPALLVTLQYPPDLVQPPPFAIEDDEVAALFGAHALIRRLGSAASTVKGEPCQETAFQLTPR